MNRRKFIGSMLQFPLVTSPLLGTSLNAQVVRKNEFKFGFGSCALQEYAQPIWRAVADAQPDLFVFLGDTIYADNNPDEHYNDSGYILSMRDKYLQLANHHDFMPFRAKTPIIGTWDDHDFGGNDLGGDYKFKEQSKQMFLEFYNEPLTSVRRSRPGIYGSYFFGDGPDRVQIILLDLRSFRSPPHPDKDPTTYLPDYSPALTMLGEAQWRWLEQTLKEPAAVRFVGSSTPFLNREHRFEKWFNFPLEQARLLRLIDFYQLNNMYVLSGDIHFGELCLDRTPQGREVVEFASSGLNRFWASKDRPNSKRIRMYDQGPNFGLVTVNWKERTVRCELRDENGVTKFSLTRNIESPTGSSR